MEHFREQFENFGILARMVTTCEQLEQIRADILRVLLEMPQDALSMDDIAEALGISLEIDKRRTLTHLNVAEQLGDLSANTAIKKSNKVFVPPDTRSPRNLYPGQVFKPKEIYPRTALTIQVLSEMGLKFGDDYSCELGEVNEEI